MGSQLTPNQTRHWAARVGLGFVAFGLAYVAASLAIDRGNPFAYLAFIMFLVVGSREFILSLRETWRRKRV